MFSTGKEQYYAVTDAASRFVLAKAEVGDKIFVRYQDAKKNAHEDLFAAEIHLFKMVAERHIIVFRWVAHGIR